jgi:hypothetical protein
LEPSSYYPMMTKLNKYLRKLEPNIDLGRVWLSITRTAFDDFLQKRKKAELLNEY